MGTDYSGTEWQYSFWQRSATSPTPGKFGQVSGFHVNLLASADGCPLQGGVNLAGGQSNHKGGSCWTPFVRGGFLGTQMFGGPSASFQRWSYLALSVGCTRLDRMQSRPIRPWESPSFVEDGVCFLPSGILQWRLGRAVFSGICNQLVVA